MKFSFTEDDRIKGPAQYMEERGKDLIDKILNGDDDQFQFFLAKAPSPKKALLVRLQTDYAGWKGEKDLIR